MTPFYLGLGLLLFYACGNPPNSKNPQTSLQTKDSTLFKGFAGESPEHFIQRIHRIHPNREVISDFIPTLSWDSSHSMIITFYAPTSKTEIIREGERQIPVGALAFAYIPVAPNEYKEILIDTIHQAYNLLNIKAVFFANCDRDTAQELVVLYSTTERHRALGIYGEYYETQVYDNLNRNSLPQRFSFLDSISKKLEGGFEGDSGSERNQIAKFKTEKEVQKELKRLGY